MDCSVARPEISAASTLVVSVSNSMSLPYARKLSINRRAATSAPQAVYRLASGGGARAIRITILYHWVVTVPFQDGRSGRIRDRDRSTAQCDSHTTLSLIAD